MSYDKLRIRPQTVKAPKEEFYIEIVPKTHKIVKDVPIKTTKKSKSKKISRNSQHKITTRFTTLNRTLGHRTIVAEAS